MDKIERKKWFEATVAIAALVMSAVSLWVAVGTEEANRKMVSAASWPLVQFFDSNADETGHIDVLKLVVSNAGVGPAKIETFELRYRGKPMRDDNDLLKTCCGYVQPADRTLRPLTSTLPQSLLRAGEARPFLIYARTPANTAIYDRLNEARMRGDIEYRACYCSVFNECWTGSGNSVDPTPVKACVAPPLQYRD